MATYKPIRKTANGTEEIKIPYAVLADPPTIPDISGKANLAGNNTFTGGQTITGQTSDGYSVNASGYVKGSWLQSGVKSNKGSGTGMVCVFDGSGLIYYRTPAEILTEAGGATTDQIPTKVSELENDSGFTSNAGTITGIKMNGSSKGTSGVVDLGTVITAHQDISGKANLSGGNTFSGLQTVNAPANSSGTEQATAKFKTANGGSITFGKEGANSGTMIRLDQTDGTCRLRFRSSATAGAMVWEQPESGAQLYVDLGARGGDYHRVQFPSGEGTLALTSQIPTSSTVSNWGFTKNTGTVTSVAVKMNGETKGTVTGSGTIDLGTVITADGGTINKSKTVKMDASANSDGANLKWGTVNSKNPYIGYASDQTDGTFVVGSLLGTNYASGLAIGGGSGNLLWKGAKVATTSDIPNISGKLDKTAFSLSGTTLTITI